jgi:hypothetical protein
MNHNLTLPFLIVSQSFILNISVTAETNCGCETTEGDQLHVTIRRTVNNYMGKRQVFNHSKGPKSGLNTDEVRVSSPSSTAMESEHEGEQRTLRLSCGGAG